MPLALPTAQTYASMLQTLRKRCKFHPTVGSAPALEDILTEANEYVFRELDDGLPWRSTMSVYAGQAEYAPFITDEGMRVARGSVQSVWIEQGDASRVPLSQGITHAHRTDAALRTIPELYDTHMTGGSGDQGEFTLEVFPTPDQTYKLHIDHNRILGRFEQSTDKPSAPARLVLQYAIAMGKAHYGQADAETVGQSFRTMLTDEKMRQRENRRFLPPTAREYRGPQVVRTASGYRQV
jgi:hypothetical protein